MAGDWMKVELSTPDKPEVSGIADLLDLDLDAAFGKLFRVWAWFDQHSTNGHAPSVTKKAIDRVAGATGFCDAMKEVGWLMEEGGLLSMPKFDRHNGKSAKNRSLALERKRKTREEGHADGSDMSRNERDGSVTREERREKRDKRGDSDTEVSGDQSPEGASARCWRLWLELVGDTQANRKVLGAVIKEHGEDAVAEAVTTTYAKGPADPVSYLRGCLKPRRRFQA